MVIATSSLTVSGLDARGPTDEPRNAESAFEEFGLDAGERPRVGEALTAIVAGENDDGIVGEAGIVERLQNASNLKIHRLHHPRIGAHRATIEMA